MEELESVVSLKLWDISQHARGMFNFLKLLNQKWKISKMWGSEDSNLLSVR